MKNKFVPKDFPPEPEEQGWLAPPGRKPPTAVGAAAPPPGGHGPGGDEYAALKRRRARRLRALSILFVVGSASFLVLNTAIASLLAMIVAAAFAAEGLHRMRGVVTRAAKRRFGLYVFR